MLFVTRKTKEKFNDEYEKHRGEVPAFVPGLVWQKVLPYNNKEL